MVEPSLMSERHRDDNAAGEAGTPLLTFHQIKSNHFRVIHGDGVFGGLTPNNTLAFTIFSERLPLPQQIVHPLAPVEGQDGVAKLGPEKPDLRVTREGVVRELEVCVMMDQRAVKALHEWLGQRMQT